MDKQSGINLIQSALNEVAQPVLAQSMNQAFSVQYGSSWWNSVALPILNTRERDVVPVSPDSADLSAMLYLLFPPKSTQAQWQFPVLQRYYNLPYEHRELLIGLRLLRNDTAHPSEETHGRFNREYTQQKLDEIKSALINMYPNIHQSLKPYYDQLQQISVDMTGLAMEWFDIQRIMEEYPDCVNELRNYVGLWSQDPDAEQAELPQAFGEANIPDLAQITRLVCRSMVFERSSVIELFENAAFIGTVYDKNSIKWISDSPAAVYLYPEIVQKRCVQFAIEAGVLSALHFAADYPYQKNPNTLFSKEERFNYRVKLAESIESAQLYFEIAKSLKEGFPFRNDALYFKYIKLAVDHKCFEAVCELAHCYYNGIGCEKNERKADELEKSVLRTLESLPGQYPESLELVAFFSRQMLIALLDFYSINAPQNVTYQKKYVELCLSMEKYGHCANYLRVGYAYENYSGILDYGKAAHYYRICMEQNPPFEESPQAKINYALLMARGRGLRKDIHKAETLIAEVALSGNERARSIMNAGVAFVAQEVEREAHTLKKKPFLNNDGFSKFAFWFSIVVCVLPCLYFMSFIAFPISLIALLRKKGGKLLLIPVILSAVVMLVSVLGWGFISNIAKQYDSEMAAAQMEVELRQSETELRQSEIGLPQFVYGASLDEDLHGMLYPYSEKDFDSLTLKETVISEYRLNSTVEDAIAKHTLIMECRNGVVDYDLEISYYVKHYVDSGWEDLPPRRHLYFYDYSISNIDPSGLVGTWVNEEPIPLKFTSDFDLIINIESAQVAANGQGLVFNGMITSVSHDQSEQGSYSFTGEYLLSSPISLRDTEIINGDDMRAAPVISKGRHAVYIDAEEGCLVIDDQWLAKGITKMKKL